MRQITMIFLMFLLTGCTLAPDYEKPKIDIPPKLLMYSNETQKEFMKTNWAKVFPQKDLRFLINKALKKNFDLKISKLSVKELEKAYDIEYAKLIPNVGLSGGTQKRFLPPNFVGGGGFGPQAAGATEGFTQKQASLNIGIASYELDFFGKLRSLKDKAKYTFLSTIQTQQYIRLTTIHKVVLSYYKIISLKESEAIFNDILRIYEDRIKIFNKRLKAGVISRLIIDREQIEVDKLKVQLKNLDTEKREQLNMINFLCQTNIKMNFFNNSLDKLINSTNKLATNLSSNVILKRPDIMAAELNLLASNANIGAARAAFFPSIILTGSIGYLSSDINTLIDPDSRSWSFNPQINLPIFTGGKLSAQLELAKVRKEKSVINYEKTIETAFIEASNTATALKNAQEILKIQNRISLQAQSYYSKSQKRFDSGVTDFLAELDAQNLFLDTKRQLVNSKLNYLILKAQFLKNIAAF